MTQDSVSLKKSLLTVFIIVGIVNISSFLVMISTQNSRDNRADVSAKMAYLSQKLAYHLNLYAAGTQQSKESGHEVITRIDEALSAMKKGGELEGTHSNVTIAAATQKLSAQLSELEEIWSTYKVNALSILKSPAGSASSNTEVKTALDYVNSNTVLLAENIEQLAQTAHEHTVIQNAQKKMLYWAACIVFIISIIAAFLYLNAVFLSPVKYFNDKLAAFSAGNLDQQVSYRGKKEYGQLAHSLGLMFHKLRLISSFIDSIGKGDYNFKLDDAEAETVKNDKIFDSLFKTQSELIKVEKENSIRQWTNEGIRIISEMLQRRFDHVQELYDNLISTIVKYVEANQGGIFLAEGENDEIQLELVACYAYERKKFLHEKFDKDEGLLGQAFIEKNIIYLTEVPAEYVKITSGIGEATPNCLILVPLKDNETVVGVLEIAAFGTIEQYKVDFLEKISELIASALNTIIVNEKTKALLSESQQQAEEMRAQEEEMRQNMEELQATQEEMARKEKEVTKLLDESKEKEEKMEAILKEVNAKERFLDGLINVSKDSILAIDKKYRIISFNEKMRESYKASGTVLSKGMDILSTFPDDAMKESFKSQFDKAFKGEFVEVTTELPMENETTYYLINYAPLRNENGEIIAAAMYSKDISAMKRAQNDAESLLIEAQSQTEEMRAQEEELKQNMEEMSAIQEELERRAREAEMAQEGLELENAMFSGLMDVLEERITIKDTNGAYLRVNRTKHESMKKLGIEEYVGKTDADIFDQQHFKKSSEIEKKIIESGKPILNEENKIPMPDGSVMYAYTHRIPFRNLQGDILGTLIVTRDATKEKQYEEELIRLKKEISSLKKK